MVHAAIFRNDRRNVWDKFNETVVAVTINFPDFRPCKRGRVIPNGLVIAEVQNAHVKLELVETQEDNRSMSSKTVSYGVFTTTDIEHEAPSLRVGQSLIAKHRSSSCEEFRICFSV